MPKVNSFKEVKSEMKKQSRQQVEAIIEAETAAFLEQGVEVVEEQLQEAQAEERLASMRALAEMHVSAWKTRKKLEVLQQIGRTLPEKAREHEKLSGYFDELEEIRKILFSNQETEYGPAPQVAPGGELEQLYRNLKDLLDNSLKLATQPVHEAIYEERERFAEADQIVEKEQSEWEEVKSQ